MLKEKQKYFADIPEYSTKKLLSVKSTEQYLTGTRYVMESLKRITEEMWDDCSDIESKVAAYMNQISDTDHMLLDVGGRKQCGVALYDINVAFLRVLYKEWYQGRWDGAEIPLSRIILSTSEPYNKFMGYTKNENGELVIVPEEAEIVKLVFRLYLEGYSTAKIGSYLEAHQIKTATGQEKWYDSVIMKMLKNEKYMGDALLQKTYTVDFMTKKKVMNNGIVPQYYVENDHEAIIPKELFYRVQEEIMRRSSLCKAAVTRKKNQKSKYSSGYALTGILLCGKCGQEYRRVTWARNGRKKIVWRCSNRLTNGVKKCGDSETLEEEALNRAVMEAIHRITRNDGDFVGAFRQNVIRVIGNYEKEQEPDEYEDKIKAKQQEMVALIAENAKTGSYTQEFDERYRSIAEEIEVLKKEQTEARKKKRLAENYEQRVKDMDAFIKGSTCQIPEFDNDLVRRLIASIKVVSAEKLIIQFQSGIVMEQEIRYD